ncbi:hypothetical protein BS50DRAFT_623747 [Corynespora cassiicola Philippines]|uniref:G domain-containing protein n=1 Tax=Corynespora cassiicola Philippines TaxID=1448308 RepID=A0A2T2NFI0_CORCC|nr:hypothetical protein BS50DRAFT_623747 [Corynespora cassiicola Philippines]
MKEGASEGNTIIAVLGMTGVGKSSFIKNITGRDDICIGHGLTPETIHITSFEFDYGSNKYTLVDTPGFDDSFDSDEVVTHKLLAWLASTYCSGIKLNDIIYLHSIAAPRMPGSAFDNLCMLKKTMWQRCAPSNPPSPWDEEKEKELIHDNRFWGRMVMAGSKVVHLENNAESALHALEQMPVGSKTTLQAQKEMVIKGMEIEQTTAARFVASRRNDLATVHQLQHSKNQVYVQLAELKNKSIENDQLFRKMKDQHNYELRSLINSRSKFYKNYKCKCRLMGRARCASCGKEIKDVFYHYCFCRKLAFLHCPECGPKCSVSHHPVMKRQETYCLVM